MAPGALAQVLRELPKLNNENLLVGFDTSDDACVYRINEDLALVQTVDFFPPMVDDPYQFGQIAAANALSDVYAMGGRPTTAMNLLCFPDCLDLEVAAKILEGGANKAMEAGCVIAGGHSISDNVPKYGMCVSGFVSPARILTNSGARVGDQLILTKPIGTGILATAEKLGLLSREQSDDAVAVMATLNKYASEAAEPFPVHACTDITGFGLVGHLCEMAEGSGVTIRLHSGSVPVLPNVLAFAADEIVPGGSERNQTYFGPRTALADSVSQAMIDVLYDPQTSGGLLFSLEAEQAALLQQVLEKQHIPASIIGEVVAADGVSLRID